MIKVRKGLIFFTPKHSKGLVKPIRRKLLSGHICVKCGIVIQALFESPGPVENELSTAFKVDLNECEEMREAHHVLPMYTSHFRNGTQSLFEEYHFSIGAHDAAGRCDCSLSVLPAVPKNSLYVNGIASELSRATNLVTDWQNKHAEVAQWNTDFLEQGELLEERANVILDRALKQKYASMSPDVVAGLPAVLQIDTGYWTQSTVKWIFGAF